MRSVEVSARTSTWRRHRRVLSMTFVLAFVLAACGGDEAAEDNTSPTDTSEESTGDEGTGDDAAEEDADTDASEIDSDAVFQFADVTSVETLDSDRPNSSNAYRWLYPIYDRLVRLTPSGELAPSIATDWEIAEDGAITFTLRDDVLFHDQTSLDAEAVRANLERSRTLETATGIVSGPAAQIADVIVHDELTVEVQVESPSSGLIFEFAHGLGMMMSPDGMDADPDTAPAGSGPFQVVDFDPGQLLRVERFDDHWEDGAAQVAGIEIINMPEAEARLGALRAGEIDMTFLEPRQIEMAESDGIDVQVAQTLGMFNLYGNLTRSDLGVLEVRQALNHGINRAALVEALAYGAGRATVQLFPEGYFAYNPEYGPDYFEYDPERSIELLEEAGFAPGEVELGILILNRPADREMGEALQDMLGNAGFTINLNVVDPARFDVFGGGDEDMFLGRWNGRTDPLATLIGVVGETGFLNPGGFAPDELTALLDEVNETFDDERRAELLRDAGAVYVEQALNFALFDQDVIYGTSGCLVDFENNLDSVDEYRYLAIQQDC